MRRLTTALLAIAAFAASANVASAKDGCGSGQYYDGNRCHHLSIAMTSAELGATTAATMHVASMRMLGRLSGTAAHGVS